MGNRHFIIDKMNCQGFCVIIFDKLSGLDGRLVTCLRDLSKGNWACQAKNEKYFIKIRPQDVVVWFGKALKNTRILGHFERTPQHLVVG